MLWAAVANAARTPAESDIAVRANIGTAPAPGPIPILVAFVGNPRFKNEHLIAYDLGYRIAFSSHVSMDTTAFYNDYTHQQTIETRTPFFATTPAPAHLVVPISYANLLHGEAHGLETAVNWKVTDRWTLSPGYAFEQIHTHVAAASTDAHSVLDTEGNTPVHSAQLRSHFNLAHSIAWDSSAYFVDRLRSGDVPSYTRLDTGLSWQLTEALSLKVVGQNLVKDRHLEFVDDNLTVQSTLIKRSAYAKFTWHF
jgi:iron complex outermembrane receptor protein